MHAQTRAFTGKSATSNVGEGSVQPIVVKDGVLVLTGYGLRVAVERGQLVVADGIGRDRRGGVLSRATCGLKRLVVLGHSGTITFGALRWLHDLGAAFIQIDADGTLLVATGPSKLDDARLRRAQALATTNGFGITLVRELLHRKLAGQAEVLCRIPGSELARAQIADAINDLAAAESVGAVRFVEAKAALAYWTAWSDLAIRFTKKDEPNVPVHWHTFGTRSSPLTGQPRLAASPINALLNYLYAILEAEARIACLAVGLDPGMGLLHADQRSRDSLALDLMEPLRPKVDSLVLDLVARRTFTNRDLFETRQGNCRLMPSVTQPLAEYAPVVAKWVAPEGEHLARQLVHRIEQKTAALTRLPTPLTQANRSTGREGIRRRSPRSEPTPKQALPSTCRGCGVLLERVDQSWCAECYPRYRSEKDRTNVAKASAARAEMRAVGQDPAHGHEAARKRGTTNREMQRLNRAWEATDAPSMTESEYREHVLPGLHAVPNRVIATVLGVSKGYAAQVKKGEKVPHPRHWAMLSRFVEERHEQI